MTDSPQRTRTDWPARLTAALDAYARRRPSSTVRCYQMLYPAEPGIVVRVDDGTPYSFPTPKAAALRVEAWVEAPL